MSFLPSADAQFDGISFALIQSHQEGDTMGGRQQQHASEEQHITWEIDGGGYHRNDCATLFEGRLYTDSHALLKARIKAHSRALTRTLASIATLVPLLAFFAAQD